MTSIEWTDKTLIVDRGGRRVRTYTRKDPSRPGKQLLKQMAAKGLKWCSGCKAWLPSTEIKQGGCREHRNEKYREYYAQKGKAAIAQRVHARKRNVDPVPPQGQEALLEQFDGLCAYCGATPATTWDHIFPVNKGGKTLPGNMVPACVSCNSSKKSTDVVTWMIAKNITLNPELLEVIALSEVLPYGNN